jgi:hypothetical protein
MGSAGPQSRSVKLPQASPSRPAVTSGLSGRGGMTLTHLQHTVHGPTLQQLQPTGEGHPGVLLALGGLVAQGRVHTNLPLAAWERPEHDALLNWLGHPGEALLHLCEGRTLETRGGGFTSRVTLGKSLVIFVEPQFPQPYNENVNSNYLPRVGKIK